MFVDLSIMFCIGKSLKIYYDVTGNYLQSGVDV